MTIIRTNLAQFVAQLEKESKGLPERQLVAIQKKIVLEALRRIVLKTPVDKGFLRAGWQVTIGIPATRSAKPPKAADARIPRPPLLANAISTLGRLQPFQTVFISNPVPYAFVLENGGFVPPDPGPSKDPRKGRTGRVLVAGGYSTQAPQGMVAVTVAELLAIFN